MDWLARRVGARLATPVTSVKHDDCTGLHLDSPELDEFGQGSVDGVARPLVQPGGQGVRAGIRAPVVLPQRSSTAYSLSAQSPFGSAGTA